jgi:hypothetical protein
MSQPIGPFALANAGGPVYFTPETIAAVELVQTGAVVRPVVWATGGAAAVTLEASELAPLLSACAISGVVFAILLQFSSGLELYINVSTALATWNIEEATQGTTPVTALRDQTGEAWLVLGTAAATAALLASVVPPPSANLSRNPFDGYSSTMTSGARSYSTDADRIITGDDLVTCAALLFNVPAVAPRTWTMPSAADVDAAVALHAAGRPVTLPGSGGRELLIYNFSGFPLTIQDSPSFGSAGGSHVIPNNGTGVILWGQNAFFEQVPGGPLPTAPGYAFMLSAEHLIPTGPVPGQGWAGGIILGDGTIVGSWGGLDLVNPYVPGSGVYEFGFDALPPGWGTLGVVTQFQNPPLQVVTSYLPNAGMGGTVYGDTIPGGAWGDYAFQFVVFPLLVPV